MNHRRIQRWLVAALMAVLGVAHAAPLGYVVSSDDGDILYRLDLATGEVQAIGVVPAPFLDVEGLALTADGSLYGIDDTTKTLIQLDTSNASVRVPGGLRGNTGLPAGITQAFDPSITFACDGRLLMSSTRSKLYELELGTGRAVSVGGSGPTMTENITDIAARGTRLYGLGHQGLHRIDPANGTSTLIGLYGNGVNFAEGGGMSFDIAGNLWAVADRSVNSLPSQIYRLDVNTGQATLMGSTPVRGIESLAIVTTQCGPFPTGVPSIPVPLTGRHQLSLLLLLLAGVGLLHLRRR